ncbi:hypothetical protein D0T11_11800 [Hymenobacter rubripertinctus]|uniref:DUF3575 domain-containing protein n=1 Tax=Hymenobacter rubripertinctus TaxID=2029981 RepID=A0A418QXF2_9BACT|nr:hypothetical protein D0T11_11800 [Hymenobacter rubripertinctus]
MRAQVSRGHLSTGASGLLLRSTSVEAGYPDPNSIPGNDITAVYRLRTIDANLLLIQASGGLEVVALKFSPDQALGLSLNARFGLVQAPEEAAGFNGKLLLDFPQYLTWRYGARATRKSQKTLGVAVGAGYRWAYFFLPFNSPSVMLEGVYANKHHDWFLRLSADTRKMQFYNDYSSEGLVPALSLQQISVAVGRSF